MTLADAQLQTLADQLWNAGEQVSPIEPLNAAHPELTIADAYEIQQRNIARRVATGRTIVGRKIGLTSLAMQQQLGVDEPDYGVITDDMVIADGGSLDSLALIAPRLEPEYAFRMDSALPAFPTMEEVRAAIGAVSVSVEIIDSRIRDWKITLVDTIADNASSAAIVHGEWETATPELLESLIHKEIVLTLDGEEIATGPGSAVLGDPVLALHWLATAIGEYGQRIDEGAVVLAGAVTAAADIDGPGTWHVYAPGFAPATLVVD